MPRKPPRSARPAASSAPDVVGARDGFEIPKGTISGIVTRAHGLWYEVALRDGPREGDIVIATMRGGLKKQRRRTDIVAVGDRVHVKELPDNEAAIVAVEPRTRALVRTARHTRDTEQVILANPDQVVFVFAIADPEPHVRMLDRFIILAERQHIPIGIVANKVDLAEREDIGSVRDIFGIYEGLYPLFAISARTGEGVEELREFLHGKTTVVAGPSGVGKSSLLNAIDPQNRREVSTVSEATGKGRHTTVGSRLYQIGDDTFVADTPGMRALAMHAVPPAQLDTYFIEFRPYLGKCFYIDCTHVHEPDCAVKAALAEGEIGQERYDSYVSLRSGEEMKE